MSHNLNDVKLYNNLMKSRSELLSDIKNLTELIEDKYTTRSSLDAIRLQLEHTRAALDRVNAALSKLDENKKIS